MIRLLIAFAGITVVLLNCSSAESGKLQSDYRQHAIETKPVAQEIKLIKYENGQEIEIRQSVRDQDSLIGTVISLFRDSEPMRVYIEDDELQRILETRTGFVLQFGPWLNMPDGNNQMYEIMFLTRGEYSNSSHNPGIIFFAAIDGKDFIRSPFIVNDQENKFRLIKDLMDQ
jgi:hypothetical protein